MKIKLTTTQSNLQSLAQCLSNCKYIEDSGKRYCTEGKNIYGWCAADSYNDSMLWATYYAGKIIADSVNMKPTITHR